ncbi:Biopolymer transport protein ExbB/TolQ [Lachnospiraceae bacterium]|nr:Biopolymer transport protein ExbB/TolQ [Lachnospiraceae bacterium]
MSNRKWYEWLLTFTYIAMILLCAYLNLFTDQKESIANIAVNIAMFIIVAIIFINCEKNSFFPTNRVIADLKKVTERIRQDASGSKDFLWNQYKNQKEDLFETDILSEQFNDYCDEVARIENSDKPYYKSDIENYINLDLTDELIHRNMLNQVSGAMTGLGILGTFIGLSLGLQSFNTGTTEEITNSITPLMAGIKVAFHTSIYGMIFSLVFNYAFKRKIDEAETAVRNFISTYKKYVLPDTENDGLNRLIELQKQQTKAINALSGSLGSSFFSSLSEIMTPEFERFDRTITSFANMATRNQLDALSVVVDRFIKEMDKSLENSFANLKDTIDQTYMTQQENAKQMHAILKATESEAANFKIIEQQTSAIARSLDTYTKDIQAVQERLAGNMAVLTSLSQTNSEHLTETQKSIDSLKSYNRSLDNASGTLTAKLHEQEAMLESMRKAVLKLPSDVSNATDTLNNAYARAAGAVNDLTNTVDHLTLELHNKTQNGRR